jgi:uncharacterized protein YndB with AHSA1/START domain
MTQSSSRGSSTQVTRIIRASRPIVYQAFVDADAVLAWLPPDGMRGEILDFEARPGGAFSMSLVYLESEHRVAGKTEDDRDTFRGRFIELVPDEKIVQTVDFESPNPDLAGTMRITWTLRDVVSGTEVTCLCENIPRGIRPEDNEEGGRSSLAKLAALVE